MTYSFIFNSEKRIIIKSNTNPSQKPVYTIEFYFIKNLTSSYYLLDLEAIEI